MDNGTMDFIGDIEAFLARHDMGEATFGRAALNKSAFIWGLKGRATGKGRKGDGAGTSPAGRVINPRMDTMERCYAFMRAYDAEHPAAVIKAQVKAGHTDLKVISALTGIPAEQVDQLLAHVTAELSNTDAA